MKSIINLLFLFIFSNIFADNLGIITITAQPDETDSYAVGDIIQEELTSNTTLINKTLFANRMLSLEEVIEQQAGVQVLQSGGLGSFGTVSLRGATGQQVKVYLDGMVLNESYGGGVDLGKLNLASVESLEIYRGFVPVQLSQASMGGAINIKSLGFKQGLNKIQVGMGSFETYQTNFLHTKQYDTLNALIFLDYQESQNNFSFINDNATIYNPDDDRKEKRNNAQVFRNNQLIKIQKDINEKNTLDFMLQRFEQNQGFPNITNSEFTNADLETEYWQGQVRWQHFSLLEQPINLAIKLNFLDKQEIFDDRESQIGLGAQYNQYITQSKGVSLYLEKLGENQNFYTTIHYSKEDYQDKDLLNIKDNQSYTRDSLELGLQAVFFFNNTMLTPSLRYENIKDDNFSKQNVSPTLGFKYNFTENISLRSNIGQYWRIPSFFELYGDRGFVKGNSDLQAETGLNFDIGLQYQNDKFNVSAFYFYSDIEDIIVYIYDAQGIGRADNIGQAKIQGIELSLAVNLNILGNINLNYTYQDAINYSEVTLFNGKKLPSHFENKLFFRWEKNYNTFLFFYEYLYEDGNYYDSANLLPKKIKRNHNIGLTYKNKNLQINTEIRNLGNENFEDYHGYPTPGTSFFISLGYEF